MNIEKFNPKKDPKYIGYIFRFLKKKAKLLEALGAYPRIVKFKGGFGWCIGWFIEDGLGDFIGSRIYYGSEKVETFCFVKNPKTEVVAEVKWDEYERIGGCAINEFVHKWREINKNSRCCEYCGQWIRRKVKTVKIIRRCDFWEIEK